MPHSHRFGVSRFHELARVGGIAPGLLFLAAVELSCSTTFRPKACASDSDCGEGFVCVAGAQSACLRGADAPLRVGMSAPLSGPSQGLGNEMKKGVALAFARQNAAGGVRGRPLEFVPRDDQYVPDVAEATVRELLDVRETELAPHCWPADAQPVAGERPVVTTGLEKGPDSVFAILGNVGTPTMVRTAPIAVETGTLFFGPFTGADRILRDGKAGDCSKYIFNVRASYAQEAEATAEFFSHLGVADAAHFVSFDQDDSFGQAGYDGLVKALTKLGKLPAGADPAKAVARFRYKRDDTSSVPAQAEAAAAYMGGLLAGGGDAHAVGVFMTDTYGPATAFIKYVKDWLYDSNAADGRATRLKVYFSNVSFVGPDELSTRLKAAGAVQHASGPKPYAEGVFVSQVVPNYYTDAGDAVRDYRDALAAAGEAPSFTSLEGYLAARIFIEGLVATPAFDAESLIATFESMPSLPIGLGATARFSSGDHQYSKTVWGTAVEADGTFSDRYFWTEGNPLQLFE